jgi:NAD(P)-dependent dehydrogenase (short-subunit alcohol dehydrogenase family)
MNSSLDGAHALVTGAGRGIGAAIVSALAAGGARVTLLGRSREQLATHAATLPPGARALVVTADVTDDAALHAAFARARAQHGPIAILVNNAGASGSAPFAKLDRATWDASIAVNLTATYACSREVIAEMVDAGYGRIVNVASTAGLVGGPYIAAYNAAKHGVIGLTRSLAAEFGRKGITVNAVCPGFTETSMLERTLERIARTTGRTEDGAATALLARNPLGRFVRPVEVAQVVAWLCRPDSAAVNGQAIVIDGGEVAR